MIIEYPRLNSALFVKAIIAFGIPFLIMFLQDGIAYFISLQENNSIYYFRIAYTPLWIKLFLFFLNLVIIPVAIICSYSNRKHVLLFIILSLGIFTAWSIIEGTSYGTIQTDGINYKSPSTHYKAEKILWSEIDNTGSLKIVDKSSKHKIKLVGLLNIEAKHEDKVFEMSFSYNNRYERTQLIEILKILQQNNIQIKTNFHYIARSKIIDYQDNAMSKQYIDILKSLTVINNEKILPLP